MAASISAMHIVRQDAGIEWGSRPVPRTAEEIAKREEELSPGFIFNAAWTARSLARGPRRLNPNAGRLKAGESLYEYAQPAETSFDWADE